MIRIGVIGYGYWGPNLVRNFVSTPGAQVVAVADPRQEARAAVARLYPGIVLCSDADELLDIDDLDAVVIATPVSTHHRLAAKALERGKHVLIEKPLAASHAEGVDLVQRAERAGRVLMVDHTFLFTGAVQAMRGIADRGELGKICYIDSTRVNLGLFQPDVNCLWDLAPHDLSIIDALIGDDVVAVDATGYGHVDPMRPDMVFLTVHYANNIVAHFNMSWMSPVKVRRFVLGGTEKMLLWDDLDQDQKIKIYDRGITFHPEAERARIMPQYRSGDIYSPRVDRVEALASVAAHFIDVIRGNTNSIMDGQAGLRVLRVLEQAQKKLDISLRDVADQRAATAPSQDGLAAG